MRTLRHVMSMGLAPLPGASGLNSGVPCPARVLDTHHRCVRAPPTESRGMVAIMSMETILPTSPLDGYDFLHEDDRPTGASRRHVQIWRGQGGGPERRAPVPAAGCRSDRRRGGGGLPGDRKRTTLNSR